MLTNILRTLLFATLFTLVSCTSAVVKNEAVNADNRMATPQNLTEKATPENSPVKETARVPETKPDELVEELYHQHDAENSPFFQDKKRALVDKYFTKSTADIIWKDAVASKGEVGALGADPLYDAQDTDIKDFKIAPAEISGERAIVTVTFENFGKKQTIKYLLALENSNWKIKDIDYEKYTLLNLYRENS